jgi:hypothetical protein
MSEVLDNKQRVKVMHCENGAGNGGGDKTIPQTANNSEEKVTLRLLQGAPKTNKGSSGAIGGTSIKNH